MTEPKPRNRLLGGTFLFVSGLNLFAALGMSGLAQFLTMGTAAIFAVLGIWVLSWCSDTRPSA